MFRVRVKESADILDQLSGVHNAAIPGLDIALAYAIDLVAIARWKLVFCNFPFPSTITHKIRHCQILPRETKIMSEHVACCNPIAWTCRVHVEMLAINGVKRNKCAA